MREEGWWHMTVHGHMFLQDRNFKWRVEAGGKPNIIDSSWVCLGMVMFYSGLSDLSIYAFELAV